MEALSQANAQRSHDLMEDDMMDVVYRRAEPIILPPWEPECLIPTVPEGPTAQAAPVSSLSPFGDDLYHHLTFAQWPEIASLRLLDHHRQERFGESGSGGGDDHHSVNPHGSPAAPPPSRASSTPAHPHRQQHITPEPRASHEAFMIASCFTGKQAKRRVTGGGFPGTGASYLYACS